MRFDVWQAPGRLVPLGKDPACGKSCGRFRHSARPHRRNLLPRTGQRNASRYTCIHGDAKTGDAGVPVYGRDVGRTKFWAQTLGAGIARRRYRGGDLCILFTQKSLGMITMWPLQNMMCGMVCYAKRTGLLFVLLVIVAHIAACGGNKLRANMTTEERLEYAMKLFGERHYLDA